MKMLPLALVAALFAFGVSVGEIEPAVGDCIHPLNKPIVGLPTSTTTWCTDSFENPVLQPNL